MKTQGVPDTCEFIWVIERLLTPRALGGLLGSLLPHRTQEERQSQDWLPPQTWFLWAHTFLLLLTLGQASSTLETGGVNLIIAFLMMPAWGLAGSETGKRPKQARCLLFLI